MVKPNFFEYFHSVRRSVLAALLLGGSCLTSLAAEHNFLTIIFNDGSMQSYVLSERPKVTFDTKSLFVKSPDVNDTYTLSDVHKFVFSDDDQTAIASVVKGECRVTFVDGSNVVVEGLNPGCAVRVFDISGKMLSGTVAGADGRASVSLEAQLSGVYVVGVEGGKSFKLVKH